MVTTTKEPELKEFLVRDNIRTMTKDLKQLREDDALKERKKIKNIDVLQKSHPQAVAAPIVGKKADDLTQKPVTAKTAEPAKIVAQKPAPINHQENIQKDLENAPDVKKDATEEEKQQIFLLQSQKADIEKHIREIAAAKKPPLVLERNKLLVQKDQWEKKLSDTMAQPPQEDGDKKEWSIEKNLADLKNKTTALDDQAAQLDEEKNMLALEIENINKDLEAIYENIKQRDQAASGKKELPIEVKTTPAVQEKPAFTAPKQSAPSTPVQPKEDLVFPTPTFSEVPKVAAEKLTPLAKTEQTARMKFMEEVEEWVRSNPLQT